MKGENEKYDHTRRSAFTLDEAKALVGYRCRLPLTGRIIDAGQSDAGVYVKFMPDERWGFGRDFIIGLDVEALDHMRTTNGD
jgi:hypothetical protein